MWVRKIVRIRQMDRKFYTRRNPNEDTPLQDLDAGVKAGHNNYSGFTNVRMT